jgi:hypothetical protein
MTVAVVAHRDHLTMECIEGREQSCGSVAFVVVGHGSAAAFLEGQTRLCPVQSLNLALFIGA